LDSLFWSKLAASAALDKKADEIVLLDLRELTIVCDYFVICTARNTQHAKAVVEGIEERLKLDGRRPNHVEGRQNARWVLLDYGDVVVHVFMPEERAFYDLERLWVDAESTKLEDVLEQVRGTAAAAGSIDAKSSRSL
jgi:ribosome-associated protein